MTEKKSAPYTTPHTRGEILEKNAEIAYTAVPTQEEMLAGGQPIPKFKPKRKADPELTREINDTLYEAAQQGNIGGG